jgi:DNA-binding transcriptional regulator GbsR (MarR family)
MNLMKIKIGLCNFKYGLRNYLLVKNFSESFQPKTKKIFKNKGVINKHINKKINETLDEDDLKDYIKEIVK